MARKKKSSGSSQVNPLGWMITFSDLVTLLLTFFVLLISMSSMDVKSIESAFATFFKGGSGPLELTSEGKMEELARLLERVEDVPSTVLLDQEEIKKAILHFQDLDYQHLTKLVGRDIKVIKEERGLVIQMADYILFNPGSAELRREYLPILSRIADVLRVSHYPISVEGHTDTSAQGNGSETMAWKLSLERAIAVMKYLSEEERLVRERFRVGGFGASKPLVPNTTPQNRAKNRRIEIILYKATRG
ncbi:MAG: flagellar motor protein MotB [Thermodesulfobacteriota bacterium]|nr:flagellar motor protein MotB [Thermodesulfobacteriota bacterium]